MNECLYSFSILLAFNISYTYCVLLSQLWIFYDILPISSPNINSFWSQEKSMYLLLLSYWSVDYKLYRYSAFARNVYFTLYMLSLLYHV